MRPVQSRTLRLMGGLAVITAGVSVGYSLATRPGSPGQGRADRPAGLAEGPGPDRSGTEVPRSGGGAGGRRALLVGVTRYDHLPPSRQLDGPVNDVALFRRLLTERFGFAPGDVVCLTEGEGRADRRPTRANVER